MTHSRKPAAAAALLLLSALAGWSSAAAEVPGSTTVETRIVPGAEGPFRLLAEGPGEPYITRDALGAGQAGRESRRRSLIYFAQLSDFQLADEESPSRVENADNAGGPFTAAWRPMEALGPQTVDAAIRQVNTFAAASPVAQAGAPRAKMDFAITTGDSADSTQLNETQWVVRLLEGGALNPNSGVGDGSCGTDPAEAPLYTGVADLDDYLIPTSEFYDPDEPQGAWSAWPQYPGLLDRAQQPFETPGLDVPSYVTFGNHDGLVQGNQAANQAIEDVATGCVKPLSAASGVMAPVPPDPARQYVSKKQYKDVHRTAASPDAHGFGFLDPAEEQASNGAAGYYSWSPRPGFRFIALDTVCDAGVAGPAAEGNVDDPQFRWLQGELDKADTADELTVLFSHHAIPSLNCAISDESAPACTGPDEHGHDVNPGCDLDPRNSSPVHIGLELEQLLLRHPHVVAWVAGHTHNNRLEAYGKPGAGFWSIRTAAEIDWPQQSRLIEFMDNRDGSLSVFGTILDHSSPVGAPAPGPAGAFDTAQLASLSRLFAANDPQGGFGSGEGEPSDRNVELVLRDPRRNPLDPTSGKGGTARRCAALRGRIRGKRVHRARLGARRAAIRRRYPSRTSRRGVDVFCLADGKTVRVRYRRRRAALIVTSSRAFAARRVRPGTTRRAFRRRVRGERRVRGGWWAVRGKRVTMVFRIRGGRVREVGLARRRATRTGKATRRLLRRF